jgi:excinuclease ABC subunit A
VADVLAMTIDEALRFFAKEPSIKRSGRSKQLGLGYLALGQPLSTLSGGEAQRIKLARPSASPARGLVPPRRALAGLHASEVEPLNDALARAREDGRERARGRPRSRRDRRGRLGDRSRPRRGQRRREVVAEGTPEAVAATDTRTGEALAGWFARDGARAASRRPGPRRRPRGATTKKRVRGERGAAGDRGAPRARAQPREVSTTIPHGKLVVVTGPSGSGKSTLAFDVVFAEGSGASSRRSRPTRGSSSPPCRAPTSIA